MNAESPKPEDADANANANHWPWDPAAVDAMMAVVTGLREVVFAGSVAPGAEQEGAATGATTTTFDGPMASSEVFELLGRGLIEGAVHTCHPRYFGVPNQAPDPIAIVAAALATAINPQLATQSHAPFAVEIERHLVRSVAGKFGYEPEEADGIFTSGGAESNMTALLVALSAKCPEWADMGVRGLVRDPVVYASAEAHPTVARSVRLAGLGSCSYRVITTDRFGRMKPEALRDALSADEASGRLPLLIVGTAGTTHAGAIDPLRELAHAAAHAGALFHVDAAWGGLLALVPELASELDGIALADSIAFDPHKTCSVPLGCGMLLVRRRGLLDGPFRDHAGYMPKSATQDPYARGMPWSRRFLGAPLFAVLASLGWPGLADRIRRQLELGVLLKERLRERGWRLLNETPLPVACFVDATSVAGARGKFLGDVARDVLGSGEAWLSVTRSANGERSLRASVMHDGTTSSDVDALLRALDRARDRAYGTRSP